MIKHSIMAEPRVVCCTTTHVNTSGLSNTAGLAAQQDGRRSVCLNLAHDTEQPCKCTCKRAKDSQCAQGLLHMPPLRSLLWFRKGLRLHDNPALLAAVDGAEQFCAVFCLDPWFIHPDRVGANRLSFLLESLAGALLCSTRARPLTTDASYEVLRCLPGLLGQNMRSCWLRAGQQKERVTSLSFFGRLCTLLARCFARYWCLL